MQNQNSQYWRPPPPPSPLKFPVRPLQSMQLAGKACFNLTTVTISVSVPNTSIAPNNANCLGQSHSLTAKALVFARNLPGQLMQTSAQNQGVQHAGRHRQNTHQSPYWDKPRPFLYLGHALLAYSPAPCHSARCLSSSPTACALPPQPPRTNHQQGKARLLQQAQTGDCLPRTKQGGGGVAYHTHAPIRWRLTKVQSGDCLPRTHQETDHHEPVGLVKLCLPRLDF